MTETLVAGPADDLKTLLKNISRALLGLAGGATGPLLGSMFKGLSDGMETGERIDAAVFSRMFQSSEKAVLKVSGAAVGDKTMIDAFVPAVAALCRDATTGDITRMLEAGMQAAQTGAESTKPLKAKKGRAKNMAEKSIISTSTFTPICFSRCSTTSAICPITGRCGVATMTSRSPL